MEQGDDHAGCHDPPESQGVEGFGLGRLPAEAVATVAAHLETCPDCQQAVAELPPDSFLGKVRASRPTPTSIPGSQRTASAETAAPPEGLPPELANYPKYRFVRELGRGGMGVVYLAEQTLMGRRVAVKVINPAVLAHPDALPRFHGEVQAAAKLDHPNIVRAYDAEQVGGLHLLVMEYVDGMNLADLVGRKGPLPVAYACHFIRQAAIGLQHAFEQGMVHRDIKPQNLMVTPKGQVKVLDFGLARLRGSGRGLTEMGSFMGTPEYVSPEQAADARTADTRADLYSLGCTLYFLLTGRPPFPEDTAVKIILAHIEKDALPVQQLRPDVPAELSAVVARLLAKDPAKRYQQPVELAAALTPFLKQGTKREGLPAPPSALPVSDRGTVLGANTSKVLKPQENPTSRVPRLPAAGEGQPGAPLADLTEAAGSPQSEKRRQPPPVPPTAWYRRPPILAGVGGAALLLVLGVWLLTGVICRGKPGKSGGFVPLFNGKDLTGWRSHSTSKAKWEVRNGVLVGSGDTGYLFHVGNSFENFHLRVEAMVNEGGNSGVYFRTSFGPGKPVGYCAQIDVDSAFATDRTGSLFAAGNTLVRLDESPVNSGEWFTLEVTADGPHLVVKVNGQVTADQVDSTVNPAGGQIALEVFGANTVVKFRKIEVKELPPSKTAEEK